MGQENLNEGLMGYGVFIVDSDSSNIEKEIIIGEEEIIL